MRLLAICAVLAASSPALADPAAIAPAARERLERGLRHYAGGEYAEAIAEFRAGHAIDPHPDFLYALGQAERKRGNCEQAVIAYRRYLDTGPPDQEASAARHNLTRCEEILAAAAAARSTAPPPAAAVQTAPARQPSRIDWPAIGLGAGGAIAAGVGATFLIRADRRADDANRATTLDDRIRLGENVTRDRWIGGIALGAGAAAMTVSLIRLVVDEPGVEVGATPTSGGGAVWLAAPL